MNKEYTEMGLCLQEVTLLEHSMQCFITAHDGYIYHHLSLLSIMESYYLYHARYYILT